MKKVGTNIEIHSKKGETQTLQKYDNGGSNLVSVVMAFIVVALAVSAYYYWHGGAQSARIVTGVVIDKFQREPGTEAGDKVLKQGLSVLTGKSLEHDVFCFIRVRTDKGEEVDIEVGQHFFLSVQVGDTVRQTSPDASPIVIKPPRP